MKSNAKLPRTLPERIANYPEVEYADTAFQKLGIDPLFTGLPSKAGGLGFGLETGQKQSQVVLCRYPVSRIAATRCHVSSPATRSRIPAPAQNTGSAPVPAPGR